jgi:hypothetical protein
LHLCFILTENHAKSNENDSKSFLSLQRCRSGIARYRNKRNVLIPSESGFKFKRLAAGGGAAGTFAGEVVSPLCGATSGRRVTGI